MTQRCQKSQSRRWALGGICVLDVSQTQTRRSHSRAVRGGPVNNLHSEHCCRWPSGIARDCPGRDTYLSACGMKMMWEVNCWPLGNRSRRWPKSHAVLGWESTWLEPNAKLIYSCSHQETVSEERQITSGVFLETQQDLKPLWHLVERQSCFLAVFAHNRIFHALPK